MWRRLARWLLLHGWSSSWASAASFRWSSMSALSRGTIGALAFVAERQPERLLATSAERAEQADRRVRRCAALLRPATSLMVTASLLLSRQRQWLRAAAAPRSWLLSIGGAREGRPLCRPPQPKTSGRRHTLPSCSPDRVEARSTTGNLWLLVDASDQMIRKLSTRVQRRWRVKVRADVRPSPVGPAIVNAVWPSPPSPIPA